MRNQEATLKKNDKIKVMSTGRWVSIRRLGIFTPKQVDTDGLGCGEVGSVVLQGIKDIHGARWGYPDPGQARCREGAGRLQEGEAPGLCGPVPHPPAMTTQSFRDALEKLSSTMPPCSERRAPRRWASASAAASSGCCTWRSSRSVWSIKYDLDLITTAPTVVCGIELNDRSAVMDDQAQMPAINNIKEIREPIAECHILLPQEYMGNVITLCIEKRGVQTNMVYHGTRWR
ncbi:hypothetical protein ACLK13_13615 [Escherichia coli]